MDCESLRVSVDDIPTRRPLDFHCAVEESALRPKSVDPVPLADITVSGSVQRVDQDFLFEGTLSAEFTHPCDRCLEPATAPVEVPVTWLFAENAAVPVEPDEHVGEELVDATEDESGSVHAIREGKLDLATPAWDELILALPSKIHCNLECKGLCPTCGSNLNDGACACESAVGAGSKFEGLKELLGELPDSPDANATSGT